jgi:hypothetical protein
VKAVNGLIILRGPILCHEEHPLLESVTAIDGVKSIENRLELHERAVKYRLCKEDDRGKENFGVLKGNCSPTARLIATAAGGALALYGVRRRGMFGSALGGLGLGIVMKALTNVPTSSHVRADTNVAVLDNPKVIKNDPPVDQAFDYSSREEEFSDVVSHETRCKMFMRQEERIIRCISHLIGNSVPYPQCEHNVGVKLIGCIH